ncbi:MAG: DNA-binding protein [Candidatus Aminicenantes bacterium]|jgi:excisionase family DNA binding protein|nr:MAG: DNA-binding protein [Candidatus Aminicenantes bacterium]
MKIDEDRLLKVEEISKILGIKPETLYQWSWLRKHLPFIKVGRALRVAEKDLDEFIEKKKSKIK